METGNKPTNTWANQTRTWKRKSCESFHESSNFSSGMMNLVLIQEKGTSSHRTPREIYRSSRCLCQKWRRRRDRWSVKFFGKMSDSGERWCFFCDEKCGEEKSVSSDREFIGLMIFESLLKDHQDDVYSLLLRWSLQRTPNDGWTSS